MEEGGQEYVFTMAKGVTFHDGAEWDCSVAKLNFDHVLAGGLRTPGTYVASFAWLVSICLVY